ncbi:hypothetical protein AX774_g7339 [Zancudomyces culisetae]|uniref:Uncharacterized protein n=1 Tax=Zancudomyces culisetae TaxID=1213189 RepID=A0A1R1PE67_ZANCU|nr:hypothetical protein AX774_g7339 [Zancudomyces culisetae]|eukprot:OMH79251.1 hypothetical protein AX774_g7339 [Zancudomyces culisetae]
MAQLYLLYHNTLNYPQVECKDKKKEKNKNTTKVKLQREMSMQQESFLNGLSTAIVCWTVVGLGFKTAKFLRKGLSNRGPTTLEEGDGTRGIEGESIYKQIDDFISNKDDRNAASGSLKLGEKDVDEPFWANGIGERIVLETGTPPRHG